MSLWHKIRNSDHGQPDHWHRPAGAGSLIQPIDVSNCHDTNCQVSLTIMEQHAELSSC